MEHDLDSLLNQPFEELDGEQFTNNTINTLIKKQRHYQSVRQKVLFVVAAICVVIASLFDLEFAASFDITSRFADLSKLFVDPNTVSILALISITVAIYLASETIEGS